MVTYFCRNCWNEIDKGKSVCLRCGAEQSELDEETFIAKLIRALNHPEPETPIRAAYILGKLEAKEAIPALIEVVHRNQDFYIVAAAIEALGEIGDRSIIKEIQELLTRKLPLPISVAAERTLRKLMSAH
jgi:HEAT repeat protein